MIKIEKDIPVVRKKCKGIYTETLDSMNLGDSFKVEDLNAIKCVLMAAKRRGYKVTTRKLDGDGYRIWLLQK